MLPQKNVVRVYERPHISSNFFTFAFKIRFSFWKFLSCIKKIGRDISWWYDIYLQSAKYEKILLNIMEDIYVFVIWLFFAVLLTQQFLDSLKYCFYCHFLFFLNTSPKEKKKILWSGWYCKIISVGLDHLKQHLSNIWSSVHEIVKQHWGWVEKKALLIKKSM